MTWKSFAAEYLHFSKKDRIAVFVFISVTLSLYGLTYVFPNQRPIAVQEDTVLQKWLDSATQRAQKQSLRESETDVAVYRYEATNKLDFTASHAFPFDPNTLDAAGWKRLGLPEHTVRTILNYRSKGGHFYKTEDLQKIWSLPDGFYEHVKDFIRIAGSSREPTHFSKTSYERKERTIAVVEVNTADTSALIALPGIGSKLAQRIVAFRDKLGGFYTVAQIGETYGLPDSTFQKLKPYLRVHGDLKKFNINTATKDELKAHPYIRWNLANAIVEYRNQHGSFKTLEDLKNIMLVSEETYSKVAPYLALQ